MNHEGSQLDCNQTELNCATTGEWRQANCQLFGLIPVCQNKSKKLKAMLLKWVIMKDK